MQWLRGLRVLLMLRDTSHIWSNEAANVAGKWVGVTVCMAWSAMPVFQILLWQDSGGGFGEHN